MPKIILSGHVCVPVADLPNVRRELVEHIMLTRAEPGCLQFAVDESQTENGKFVVYEEFATRAAFEAHQQRVAISQWGRISKNVERVYTIREV